MKILSLICILILTSIPSYAESFRTSKKILENKIYNSPHKRVTFYCGCRYRKNKTIIKSSCNFRPKHRSSRSYKVEWEHVVPAKFLAQGLNCSTRVKCKQNREFRRREADIINLVPVIGELNLRRSSKPYGIISGEKREFGGCDFEINGQYAEPKKNISGDLARRWFYMSNKYNLTYPKNILTWLSKSSKLDPVTKKETRLIETLFDYYLVKPVQ